MLATLLRWHQTKAHGFEHMMGYQAYRVLRMKKAPTLPAKDVALVEQVSHSVVGHVDGAVRQGFYEVHRIPGEAGS